MCVYPFAPQSHLQWCSRQDDVARNHPAAPIVALFPPVGFLWQSVDMRAPVVALAFLATSAVAAAEPVTLWSGAKVGMSREAVMAKFPGGKAVEGNYGIERTMLGKPATVTFVFKQDGLSEIAIGIRASLDEAKSGLAPSYGTPLGCQVIVRGGVQLCRWRKGALNVAARAFTISDPYVQIEYTAGAPDDATF